MGSQSLRASPRKQDILGFFVGIDMGNLVRRFEVSGKRKFTDICDKQKRKTKFSDKSFGRAFSKALGVLGQSPKVLGMIWGRAPRS